MSTFGKLGRPSQRPTIESVSELTQEDLDTVQRLSITNSPIKTIRDSHHMVARLFAMGLTPGQVAAETGYSPGRITTLQVDPSVQELIAHYRNLETEAFLNQRDEYYETVASNRKISALLINDKLNSVEPNDISFRELVLIHSDAADRTGYPKRTVALNVNADFASLLDKAIARTQQTKMIELSASTSSSGAGPGGQEPAASPDPQRRTGT